MRLEIPDLVSLVGYARGGVGGIAAGENVEYRDAVASFVAVADLNVTDRDVYLELAKAAAWAGNKRLEVSDVMDALKHLSSKLMPDDYFASWDELCDCLSAQRVREARMLAIQVKNVTRSAQNRDFRLSLIGSGMAHWIRATNQWQYAPETLAIMVGGRIREKG